jgi:hypothetical protein
MGSTIDRKEIAMGQARCDRCGSQLPDPTGLDLLAFQLRNAYWQADFMDGVPHPWQLLDEPEREKWRCVARVALSGSVT